MLRVKANKTSLFNLVRKYDPAVGGFRNVEFHKIPRQPDYFLDWGGGGLRCHAFFATCMGKPLLSIQKTDFDGNIVSRATHTIDLEDLRERGMVEEFTSAVERRRQAGGTVND